MMVRMTHTHCSNCEVFNTDNEVFNTDSELFNTDSELFNTDSEVFNTDSELFKADIIVTDAAEAKSLSGSLRCQSHVQ